MEKNAEKSKENLLLYLADLKKSVEEGQIDAVMSIGQRSDGAYETAFIGQLDPFSMLGFSLFVQMKKIMDFMPSQPGAEPPEDKGLIIQ